MEMGLKLRNDLNVLIGMINEAVGVQKQVEAIEHKAGAGSSMAASAAGLVDKLTDLIDTLYQPEILAPEDAHNYPVKLRVQFITLQHFVDSADTGPLPQAYTRLQDLTQQLDAQVAKWKALEANDIPAFDRAAAAAGLGKVD